MLYYLVVFLIICHACMHVGRESRYIGILNLFYSVIRSPRSQFLDEEKSKKKNVVLGRELYAIILYSRYITTNT